MNKHVLEGNYKELKGRVREKWGWWTHQYSSVVGGKFNRLVGRLQSMYGKLKK
jgi:uncharacterized protein YjbJ (UPF0337 family)